MRATKNATTLTISIRALTHGRCPRTIRPRIFPISQLNLIKIANSEYRRVVNEVDGYYLLLFIVDDTCGDCA